MSEIESERRKMLALLNNVAQYGVGHTDRWICFTEGARGDYSSESTDFVNLLCLSLFSVTTAVAPAAIITVTKHYSGIVLPA